MPIGTMINVNGWFGVLIESKGTLGLFQNPKNGGKICYSISGVKEKQIVFVPETAKI